jgi:hypothetical protein
MLEKMDTSLKHLMKMHNKSITKQDYELLNEYQQRTVTIVFNWQLTTCSRPQIRRRTYLPLETRGICHLPKEKMAAKFHHVQPIVSPERWNTKLI